MSIDTDDVLAEAARWRDAGKGGPSPPWSAPEDRTRELPTSALRRQNGFGQIPTDRRHRVGAGRPHAAANPRPACPGLAAKSREKTLRIPHYGVRLRRNRKGFSRKAI